ncbi:MAG TPA: CTP synthase, partial [Anaerolineae bacterium]
GVYPCCLVPGTKAAAAYDKPVVDERHRHRWEFNNSYRELLQEHGMAFSGLSPDGRLVEIAELTNHPFMLGSQFHPQFKSRPNRPHPLFDTFLRAAVAHQEAHQETQQRSNGAVLEKSELERVST